jgi:drug/metabolite transporter (DMT)-like permease
VIQTISLTMLALLAFAGNSVLCRLALDNNIIDAASFTSIRLFSGIVFLLFLVAVRTKQKISLKKDSWLSAFFLFLYALAFSYGYITLDTGTGALILFGAVQTTMIIYGLIMGRKLLLVEWVGLLFAALGLCILLLPGASAPSLNGFILMAISGAAWGAYTLAGKGSQNPLVDTAHNFLKTLPLIAIVTLLTLNDIQLSNKGIILAIISGAVMSGLGYAIWYSVLTKLSVTEAATIQLSVPIIATIGGVIFSNELVTIKLMLASILVLGGVLIVTLGKQFIENKYKKGTCKKCRIL